MPKTLGALSQLVQEAYGLRLANWVSAVMRDVIDDVPRGQPAPLGPGFIYTPSRLYPNRRGHGPLHVVWDTNLLIDYFENGAALWTQSGWSPRAAMYEDEMERRCS